ncbi:MAG: VanW family protein [Bacilli bacterium]
MKIEFDSNFNKFSFQEKLNYLEQLLNQYPLNVIVTNLIYHDNDIIEVFDLMNKLKQTKIFKNKYRLKNPELLSLIINTLVKQNKNKELYEYLSKKDKITLDKIINYEIKHNTSFSKTKMCRSFLNTETNNKKVLNYDDSSSKKVSKTKKILNKEIKSKKVKLGIGTIILIVVFTCCYLLVGSMYAIIFYYNNHIYPRTYLDNKLIEGNSYEEVNNYLKTIDDGLTKEIHFNNTNDSYTYTYEQTGLSVNTKNVKEELTKYKKLNGFKKIYEIFFKKETKLVVNYQFDESRYQVFLTELQSKTEVEPTLESLQIINGNINYKKGLDGFKLDTSNLKDLIIQSLQKDNQDITLEGEVVKTDNRLNVINSKVSSFTTEYLEYQRRSINIRQAVKRLNGKIVYPNEIFSFYKTVGPYNSKNGYVFYGEYVGSGVCQVSTTIYNAALLLNLPIVERLNHGAMVPYVDYGMDATVYSNTTDFRFKNNSNYPIYIEASADNGKLTINFWSNENIIEKGYRYQPRSVKIGKLAYKTYLDTYYNDELIKTTYLNSSYYYKGK